MTIWRWGDRFSDVPLESRITLGEGDTPVVRSRSLGPSIGLNNLYFKLEMTNPSGSFKDRFAASAISHMVAHGKTKCIATSSGNTGAALAAYCAAAGIECRIAIVETAPIGKLKQMMAYGAKIARVRKFGIDPEATQGVLDQLQKIGQRSEWSLQVSAFVYSSPGMAGVQSLAYELPAQFDQPISRVFCPAGGGGLCVGAARGFLQMKDSGELAGCPKVECVQPEGNDTISTPLREGATKARAVDCTSKISGLQVASVVDGDLAIEECRRTGGTGYVVSDELVWKTQKILARDEGVFSEPAGAVSVAAVVAAAERKELDPDELIVCLVTGFGFKDDAAVDRMNSDVECPMLDVDDVAAW